MGKWKGIMKAGFLEIPVNVTYTRSSEGVSEWHGSGETDKYWAHEPASARNEYRDGVDCEGCHPSERKTLHRIQGKWESERTFSGMHGLIYLAPFRGVSVLSAAPHGFDFPHKSS